jgi:small subunit ribosomal protein S8
MSSIADMLTRISNAQARGHQEVVLPFSKMLFGIAQILKKSGFVEEVNKIKKKKKSSEVELVNIRLKYENGVGAIRGIKLISRPSRRIYIGKKDLKPVKEGYGISVISTPRGLMTGDEAKKAGVGGEILFEMW